MSYGKTGNARTIRAGAELRAALDGATSYSEPPPPAPLEGWGRDDYGFADGVPGAALGGSAVQVWAILQGRKVTVAEAAAAFNLDPRLVLEAVAANPWLYAAEDGAPIHGAPSGLDPSRLTIEHDGE
jgi:hypothetical protein